MEKNKDSKINITYVNSRLLRANNMLYKLDRMQFERASRILKSDELAFYLTVSQKDQRYTPLLNRTSSDELIFPELESDFVTVGEVATYFMVDFEELYTALKTVNFDLEKFEDSIAKLRQDREKFLSVSNSLGKFSFQSKDGSYNISLADIAQLRNIPFEMLYNEYLLNNMDIGKSLKSIEDNKKLKERLVKMRKVVSLPVSKNHLTRYCGMVRSGEKYRINLYTAIMRGVPALSLEDENMVMKMFLINFDTRYIDKEEMSEKDLVKYFNYIYLALTNGKLTADEVRELIWFSKSKRLPVNINTQTFTHLLLGKKNELNLNIVIAMIKTCIAENELLSKDEDVHESLLALLEQIEKINKEKVSNILVKKLSKQGTV